MELRPHSFGPKPRGISQFGATPRGFAPHPRTQTLDAQMCPNVPLTYLPWGTWFLQARAGKAVRVRGFATEARVFDTELAEGPSGGGVGGEVNLPDAF